MTLKKYVKLFQYLRNEEGFGFSEAIQVMKKIDKVDAQVKEEFESWLLYRTTPNLEFEGISFNRLTKEEGMKPVRAFLMLDWIKRDPLAAVEYLRFGRHSMPMVQGELTEEQIQQLKDVAGRLRQRGVDVQFEEAPHPIDGVTDEDTVSQVVEREGISVLETE